MYKNEKGPRWGPSFFSALFCFLLLVALVGQGGELPLGGCVRGAHVAPCQRPDWGGVALDPLFDPLHDESAGVLDLVGGLHEMQVTDLGDPEDDSECLAERGCFDRDGGDWHQASAPRQADEHLFGIQREHFRCPPLNFNTGCPKLSDRIITYCV